MRHPKYLFLIFTATAGLIIGKPAEAQNNGLQETQLTQIVVSPLFEYPVPPDNLEGLAERCNWLMDHFWDAMDFKTKNTVDQSALNHAFSVYANAMMHADVTKADESVDRLISKIAKNPVLSIQFAKAAEETVYGPRAEFWIDEVFIKFIDNVLANKSLGKDRKLRYETIRKKLASSLQGSVPSEFDYMTPEGKTAHYHPNGIITVIQFGTPDCPECRLAKLKMDTDITFSSMVEKGKINVLYINPSPAQGWQEEMKGYPANWHVGASEGVVDLYDLRIAPAIYVIDREGKIAVKNVNIETAMRIAIAAATE